MHYILAYAIITLLSCILCTSSFVAGVLAKSIRTRPESDQVMDRGSLQTVLAISRFTFYVSSGASAFLLLVGAGVAIFWVLGLI